MNEKRNNNNNPSNLIEDEKKYDNTKQVSLVIVGCGNRGYTYSIYSEEHPNRLKIVAVTDPIKYRREKLGGSFNVDPKMMFADWRDIISLDHKIADAALIATPDVLHAEAAIAFAKKGYHLLVEKPMAVTLEDCNRMIAAAKEANVIFAVCHVLRYTPYNLKIKELIDQGYVGKVMNIQHLEPIGYYHTAHSYVRGNWRREDESSFTLLTKSCHDIDLLNFFMGGAKVKRVSSFGSLSHFKKENKPAEAGDAKRCLDCKLVDSCPYSAKTIYLVHYPWKRETVVPEKEPTKENVREALATTSRYGICVYESDNNVVDQQVVNFEYEDGRTCSFSMVAFTDEMCVRKTRIFGTHGELICDGHSIYWTDFKFGDKEIIKPEYCPCKPIPEKTFATSAFTLMVDHY
eukprot:gene3587-4468_t